MINSSGVQMASDKGAVQSCHASFVFSRGSGKDPGFMVGGATGSNLQVQDVSFSLKGGYSKDSKAPAENDVSVELKFDKGQLVISPGDGDGFIKKIFGGAKPDPINFDLGIGWSYQKGFHFTGSADFTKKIPVGLNLGDVLKIDSVLLALGASNDGIHANASTTALVSLGPVAATVSEFGLGLNLDFKDDSKGNLGPLHARLGFKAPTKVALSIDADVVSGAGEIDYDDAAKRYAGLLHLEFESFALNAMGALDTKLPGGVDGYSLIVMISTEFDDGIPLGEGFSLNGFGGIVGINRSVSTSELQNAVLAGKISDIMFPEIDPKKDTSQILSRLTAIFPPTEGKYVFAPLVEIDWGAEEQFIFGQLGLVVELPQLEHIALIGHFDAYFPTPDPDKRLLELHLDVAGMLDRPAKYLQILCDIHDSKFKGISIYGDILVRYSWGDDPEFVLSIGGFHPAFHPPAGLPALKRLGLEMGNGDALKIGVQSYLAITTNSFQFGVAGQFVFKEGSFKVVGGIAFNTLIIFTPFHFSADFSAGMSVSYKDYDFASLWVTANVEGPHQWHVWGSVSVSLFFFDLSYSFDKRWGEVDTKVVVQPKVADELLAALNDAKNMASVPPIEYAPVVRFDGPPKDGAPFYVNPAHGISIRQKVAPLGLRLSKFHEVPLTTPVQFDLPAKSTDGQLPLSPLLGQFATGQYQVLSQAQALSSPSFEPRVAGFAFGDDRVATADATPAATRYVTEYDVSVQGTPPPVALKAADLEWMIRGGAAARFRQRGAGARKFMPAQGKLTKVSVGQELYFVVKKSDLTKITAQALPYDQAELQLKSHLAAPGGWRDDADLMIVPDYELSA
ncbi:MAG: hypothetical protein HY075_01665 [Deltaproteobacteria bacterium]|nr:hypothetical protein [Deltaproteobacteria bacterium]